MPGAQFDVGGTTMPLPPCPEGLAPPGLPADPAGPAAPATPEPVDPALPELPLPTSPVQPARPATSKIERVLRMTCICISSCPSAGGTRSRLGAGRSEQELGSAPAMFVLPMT